MHKIITAIITTLVIFSSISTTNAEDSYIERLLDLNYWVEQYNLDLSEIKYISFNNDKYNRIYNELKMVDSILKKEIMKNYRNWDYTYYQANWIVTNYNNFVYYTNKFFFYLKLKEQNNNYKEVDTAIIRNYTNMRTSYNTMKNIIKGY